jgi:hypothetical protein
MRGCGVTARIAFLAVWCVSPALRITSAWGGEGEWYSRPYQITIGFQYTSQCNPGVCEGEKALDLMATVEDITFGHAPIPDFGCWIYEEYSGTMTGTFGHGKGEAAILNVAMCSHLSGSGEEPNRIVGRNDDFDINLSILPEDAARDYLRETGVYGADTLEVEPLVDMTWMHFQAMTPFSNPAVEWENSDGNGLVNSWAVVFSVPTWRLKESQQFEIEVPVEDECGSGKWLIRFLPSGADK